MLTSRKFCRPVVREGVRTDFCEVFRQKHLESWRSVFCASGAFGCSSGDQQTAQTAAKPAEPAIPDDVQAAATALLGKDTTVLVFGDLAKTGTRQLLAVNLVPKTPKDTVAGTIITRAVIAEDTPEGWHELVRCDEHLKNAKGYLGGSPIEPVSGWKLQFEKTDIARIECLSDSDQRNAGSARAAAGSAMEFGGKALPDAGPKLRTFSS